MRYLSVPKLDGTDRSGDQTPIVLFGRDGTGDLLTAGWSAAEKVRRQKLMPDTAAWDLLAIALSVVVADGTTLRSSSPDGWTRQIELEIALSDPDRWSPHADAIATALRFLTTDRWTISFRDGGTIPTPPKKPRYPTSDAVALLSGGLDSLIGAIDLTAAGTTLLAVSQTVRGDAAKQDRFAQRIGGGIDHLQLNHNASTPRGQKETSQRSRSLIFLAFAVLAATATRRHAYGQPVPLYVCENGFIAINPPLTTARVGSLSTRTAHPEFLGRMQSIFDAVGLNVQIKNPYAEKTKGEMLRECLDQDLLSTEAPISTSCGRFQRFNYRHCGRCVPCQIRRASFEAWGRPDPTEYVYDNLAIQDEDHAAFDDVRSVAIALLTIEQDGFDRWLGPTLSSPLIHNRLELRDMLQRGFGELRTVHEKYGLV